MKLKVGDLIEVVAVDHTSDDTNGWLKPEELIKAEPERIAVVGYYLGETKNTLRLAMAKAGNVYGTQFMILKGTIETVRRSKNAVHKRRRTKTPT